MKENLVIKGRNKDKNENCYLVYGVEIANAASQIVDLRIDSVNGKIFLEDLDRTENGYLTRNKKRYFFSASITI